MSNQRYRKEEQEGPTRAERLKAARAQIDKISSLHDEAAKGMARYVSNEYQRLGGDTINSQIEGLLLVIEEGKIYRNQALDYDHAMKQFKAGKIDRQPREPGKAAISGATMVSASRQLEVLRERKDRLLEDAMITIGEMSLNIDREKEKAKQPKPEPTEPQPPKNQPPVDKEEATPPKEGKRAATAAA